MVHACMVRHSHPPRFGRLVHSHPPQFGRLIHSHPVTLVVRGEVCKKKQCRVKAAAAAESNVGGWGGVWGELLDLDSMDGRPTLARGHRLLEGMDMIKLPGWRRVDYFWARGSLALQKHPPVDEKKSLSKIRASVW